MEAYVNEPISYDDHGDVPFNIPFREISPSDISFYFQLNTIVGKTTCRQSCTHCFFINQPEAKGRSMDLLEGRQVIEHLQRIGYKVFPMVSDSFANNGEFLRIFPNSHNRDVRQEPDRRLTKTMHMGELWTSGAPLLEENWEKLLSIAVENGFGSVTITFHGVLDGNLNILPKYKYPIKGIFYGDYCETVIKRIHNFNEALLSNNISELVHLPASCRRPIQINLGVTIGKHNNSRENLIRYVNYFNNLDISLVRFNCFHDHGSRHPELAIDRAEIAQVYQDIKWIHSNIKLSFQLGIDEDFGTNGIEVMGFPKHIGWCRAGRQLFAIVPDTPEILFDNEIQCLEKIGVVAGCVDAFKPIVGYLIRQTNKGNKTITYDIKFFHDVIDDLNRKRLDGTYTDGCFATEMLSEISLQGKMQGFK